MEKSLLKNKKALVTGGAGFIGSHTVEALLKQGAEVFVIDDLSTGRKENLPAGVKFYEMDVGDRGVVEILKNEHPHYIYHFAFNTNVPGGVLDPSLDAKSVLNSMNILNAVAHLDPKPQKVIFPSSGFIYGNRSPKPTVETSPCDPVSPYGIAKYAIELFLKYLRSSFGLSYVILRYAAVYGPRQKTGAMAAYIRDLHAGNQSEIYGDGSKTRDYVYIDDVVEANLLALNADDSAEPVFNVGTSEETSLLELYQKIARSLGKEAHTILIGDRPGEQQQYALDYNKIKNILGWAPKTELEEGLTKTLRGWNLI